MDENYTSYLYLAQAYRLLLRDDKVKFCIDKAARLADNEIRRFNVEFTSALMLFDILDEGAYIELYQRVTANPLFAYIADSESRITLQTMYLIAKGQCHEALKELEKIENIQTRYEMKISALKKMKRYDMALAVSDTLQLINDSIRSILQIEDLAQAQSSIGKAHHHPTRLPQPQATQSPTHHETEEQRTASCSAQSGGGAEDERKVYQEHVS